MASSFTPPFSSSSYSSSSASSMHSLYDNEYDDRIDSDSHAAKAIYNYHFNPNTVTYEAYANRDCFDDYYHDDYELHNDYDDYDNIRLVPPSRNKPKSKRNNRSLKPKTQKKQPVETKVIQPLLECSQPPEQK